MSRATRAQQIADEAAEHFAQDKPGIFIPRAFNALGGLASNHVAKHENEEEAFPPVKVGLAPSGSRILVQLRVPVGSTTGGNFHLDSESRKTELDNTQVAKVVAVGDMAFKHRATGAAWPEGSWCQPGDYVRVPKYQGDRFVRKYVRNQVEHDPVTDRPKTTQVEDNVVFILLPDLDVIARYDDWQAAIDERAFL